MMYSRFFQRTTTRALAFAGAVGSMLAGCASSRSTPVSDDATPPKAGAQPVATSTSPSTAEATAPLQPPKGIPLVVGMSADEVRTLMGAPLEVRPMDVDGVKADVWVYHRRIDAPVRQVTTGMREVPYVDPVTGITKMIQEPIIGYVTETNEVELKLLIFQGKLQNWRELVIRRDKSYS